MGEVKSYGEFMASYFKGLVEASGKDYGTFSVFVFAAFATVAFGIRRGLAYATGMYAVLYFMSVAGQHIAEAIHNLAGAVMHRDKEVNGE